MWRFALAVLELRVKSFSWLKRGGCDAPGRRGAPNPVATLLSEFADDAGFPIESSLVRLRRKLSGRLEEPDQSACESFAGPLRGLGDDALDSLRA
jgi:hypothetical protein